MLTTFQECGIRYSTVFDEYSTRALKCTDLGYHYASVQMSFSAMSSFTLSNIQYLNTLLRHGKYC